MNIEEILQEEIPPQLGEDDLKEQLNILVSSGRAKEMVGKNLTHDDVRKLSEEEVKKLLKKYEAALAGKTTDAIADSAIKLATKLLGFTLPIDDIEALQKDLQNNYLIFNELKIKAGWLSLKCGSLMAVASAVGSPSPRYYNRFLIYMASSQNEVPEQEPAQVPDKSPKSEKITKPKNPGRVAAGKRLAEMNRKNKAMKNPPTEHHLNINWGYVLAGGGLLIAGGSLYYAYKEHQRAVSTPRMTNPLPVSTPVTTPKKKLMEME